MSQYYPEASPSARAVLLSAPVALPGKCVLCGKAEHPVGFVSTGFRAEYYGMVIYCGDCIVDLASVFDLVPSDYVQEVLQKLDVLNKQYIALTALYSEVLEDRDASLRLVGRLSNSQPVVAVDTIETVSLNNSAFIAEPESTEPEPEPIVKSKPKSPKPISLERSNDSLDVKSELNFSEFDL